jgi:small subunit ribosomal protein S9
MAASKKYYWGTGRRKSAVARVRLSEGTGRFLVNDRELEDYFTEDKDRGAIVAPLEMLDLRNRVDIMVNTSGGGFTGQAGATLQGVARALKVMYSPADGTPVSPTAEVAEGDTAGGFIKKLRDSGYLTRDSRMKERKKYGKKGARKSFQFSKR